MSKRLPLIFFSAFAGFSLVFFLFSGNGQGEREIVFADQADDPYSFHLDSEANEDLSGERSEEIPFGEDQGEGRVQGMHELRPIEDFPVLTWADRVDWEGQSAPRTARGQHGRRILEEPVRREILRDNPEPVRPFGEVRRAREESLFAYNPHVRSAVEVEVSHRLFHLAASGEFHRIEVPVTTGRTVTVNLETLLHRGPHTFSFWGKVEEHPDSQVVMVYNEGTVAGGISLYGVLDHETINYEFVGMEDGLIAVQEVDPETFLTKPCGVCGGHHPVADVHRDDADVGEDDGLLDDPGLPEADPSVDHIVDIVVGYGRQARIADGGTANIEGRIIAAVDRMNITFENSLVDNTRLVLLAMQEDPYYEFGEWGTHPDWGGLGEELAALQSATNGRLDTIAQLRLDLGADFSAFIVRQQLSGHAGLAFRPGVYSVTARNYMSNSQAVFVHEVGHNYGLRHGYRDSSSASDTDVNSHNYAWRFQDVNGNNRRRTVMSYGSWTKTLHFSNPDVIHPANNARVGAVNGFDGSDDPTVDPQLVSRGYDGTNANLGARSAHFLVANAAMSANRLTRQAFAVNRPQGGETVAIGETYWIEWVGGVHDDTVDIELWRDDVLWEVLEEDYPNTSRTLAWIPAGLASSENYRVRIVLNGGEEDVLSAPFTIEPDYPRVVSTFVAPLGVAEPGLSEVSVTFNRSIDTQSFTPGTDVTRFVGPGGENLRDTLTDFIWSADDTVLTFTFNALEDPGFYRLDFGPQLLDLRGFPMDQNGNEIPGEVDDGFGFTFRVGELADGGPGARLALYSSDFEEDAGGFSLQEIWAWGIPGQQSVGGPGSAFSGQRVLATNLNGNYPQNINIYATSPVFSTLDYEAIELEFQRWLGLSWGQQGNRRDSGLVEYRVGNGPWTELWSNNGAVNDGEWTKVTYSLPADAENQNAVQIRFNLDTANQSSLSYGWNIDDLVVSGIGSGPGFNPPPAPQVVGHMPAGAVIQTPSSIWIDFDQPMNPGSFSLAELSGVSGADASFDVVGYAWTANNRLRLDLTGVNEDGSYTLTLGTGVQSSGGDALAESYKASFELGTFDPPVILTQNLPMAHEGEFYSATLEAMSPDGLALQLSVSGLPSWLNFADQGNDSGFLTGTPPSGTPSPVSLTFTATDSANASQETLSLMVNRPPLAEFDAPLTDSVRIPDGVLLLFAGSVSDDGLPGSALTQSWSVLSAPNGATVTFEDEEVLETAVSFDAEGDYELRFTVSDGVLSSVYDFLVETGAVYDEEEGSSGWTAQDIGSGISTPGETTFAGGAYTLSVDSEDIWGNSDSFHYAWQQISGDWVVEAEINWLVDEPFQFAKSGLMIRETLDADSKFAMAMFSGLNNDVYRPRLLRRTSTGGSVDGDWGTADHNWVRLVRSGDNFSLYQSLDGESWSHVQTRSVSMTEEVYVGLALSSHQNSGWTQVEFSHVEGFGGAGNIGPLVYAGEPRMVDLSESVVLAGSVEDDGLPEIPGDVSTQWLLKEGPMAVSFSDDGSLTSGVTFSQTGVYTLRLTAFDGEVKTAHDKVVTVEDALEAPEVTQWPTASELVFGQTLGESILTGGVASVPGNFAFTSPATVPEVGTEIQSVIFTPEDTETYASVVGEILVTVAPAEATVTLSNLTQTYQAVPLGPTVTTEPAGLAVTLTFDGESEMPVNVGSYLVVATVNDPNASGSASGILIIDPAPLTVVADNQVKSLGEADPELTWTVTEGELLAGDTVSGELSREPGETIGGYLIEQGTLSVSANYNLTFVLGTLTIQPGDISIALLRPTVTDVRIPAGVGLLLATEVSEEGGESGMLNLLWSQHTGEGTVSWEHPDAPETVAWFSDQGSYTIRLTVENGTHSEILDIAVEVVDPALIAGQPAASPEGSVTVTGWGATGPFPMLSFNSTYVIDFADVPDIGDFGNSDENGMGTYIVVLNGGTYTYADGTVLTSSGYNNYRRVNNSGDGPGTHQGENLSGGKGVGFGRQQSPLFGIRLLNQTGQAIDALEMSFNGVRIQGSKTFPFSYAVTPAGVERPGGTNAESAGPLSSQYKVFHPALDMVVTTESTFSAASELSNLNLQPGETLWLLWENPDQQDTRAVLDTIEITPFDLDQNIGPLVIAGESMTVESGEEFTLNGSVQDDGLPLNPGTVSTEWVQLSGPSTVTFADASMLNPTLVIPAGGDYHFRLVAFDGEVATTDEVLISVGESLSPPIITAQPEGRTVTEGQSVTFTVAAEGEGTMLYQWRKDGEDIANAISSSLILDPVGLQDSGLYSVVVSHDGGSTTSEEALLTVEEDFYQAWLREFDLEDDTQMTVWKGGREVTLREAYLLGSDPHDPRDMVRIVDLVPQADEVRMNLYFHSLENRLYEVEWSDQLTADSWLIYGPGILGDGTLQHFNVPMDRDENPRRFYRIRVSFPD